MRSTLSGSIFISLRRAANLQLRIQKQMKSKRFNPQNSTVRSPISQSRFILFALLLTTSAVLAFGSPGLAGRENSNATENAGPIAPIATSSISAIPRSGEPPAGTSTPGSHSTQLKIAFVNSMPPYEMAEDISEVVDPYLPGARPGIQIDLVKAAFEGSGYTFTAVFQ